jgi:hypothetical protein
VLRACPFGALPLRLLVPLVGCLEESEGVFIRDPRVDDHRERRVVALLRLEFRGHTLTAELIPGPACFPAVRKYTAPDQTQERKISTAP